MSERMEISEQFYKGRTPSKAPIRVDSNRESHVRKHKGGESASSIKPKKGGSDKRKTKTEAIRAMY